MKKPEMGFPSPALLFLAQYYNRMNDQTSRFATLSALD